ncbi:MAG: hypothetical protein HC802_08040 [Caldilineaceae bacterium]|nr:hypothetical protein [Caldilineaceae bacterium]
MRSLALAGLRQRHPNADEPELRRRLADLTLGPKLAAQVYGPIQAPESGMAESTETVERGD